MLRIIFRAVFLSLLLLLPLGIYLAPALMANIVESIVFLVPLWLPFILIALVIPLWITYTRSQYAMHVPYTVLELKPGELTPHTAQAMELIFYSLHHHTKISRLSEILLGEMRLPWSLDITASNGAVRFYMRVPKAHRQAVELRVRAEYRDIDIDEVRDYARELHFDPVSMKLDAREFSFVKPDPYPIKTYDAYESDKKPRDPFSEMLEGLVGVGEDEQYFISLIIRPHQRERRRIWEDPTDTLHRAAQEEIAKILGVSGDLRKVPEGKQRLCSAIETALKKPSFDCGMRALYIAKKHAFNQARSDGLETLLAPFSDVELNMFQAYTPRKTVSWPLSDIFVAIPWLYEVYVFNLYRRRAYFTPPYYGKPFVLNTAELATVFHLPHITRASALARGSGRRLEPPENLPV